MIQHPLCSGSSISQTIKFTTEEKQSGLKILSFLRMVVSIKKAYTKQLRKVLEQSALKIQRMYCSYKLMKDSNSRNIHRANLTLSTKDLCIGTINKVEVFGEFSADMPSGAWAHKIVCQKVDDFTFTASLKIKLGQKFKFRIDDGREFAVSQHYMQTKEPDGNTNNIYQFHSRTRLQDSKVVSRYKTKPSFEDQILNCSQNYFG